VENEDIIVSGDSKSGVANACSRILLIVESSRSKMGHTHFISIPMNTKEMQDAQLKFKQDVLQLYLEKSGNRKDGNSCASSRQIDETLFQTPSMLHLTIGALALLGK
jgi:activating signal cointegrator complex subunit 1